MPNIKIDIEAKAQLDGDWNTSQSSSVEFEITEDEREFNLGNLVEHTIRAAIQKMYEKIEAKKNE